MGFLTKSWGIHANPQREIEWTQFQLANAGCSLMFPMADKQENTQLNGVRAALQGKWKNKNLQLISLEPLTCLFGVHPTRFSF